MNNKKNFNPDKDFYWLAFFSFLLFVVVIIAFYREANPEWKKYQREFKNYLEENISPESASAFEFSVKQLWLPELNKVDRCISCHLGYDQPNLTEAPEPYAAHPDILPHSVLKMGCTICHGGQGFALKKKDAHGEVEHWEEPMLGAKLAKKYGFESEKILMQMNCNTCHRRDEDLTGMEMINLGKNLLTQKKKCQTCHIIDGKGGKLAADLTFIGDKPAERFDFSQIKDKLIESERPLSVLSWHFEHFMNPKAVVPDSKMPYVKYTEEEAWALAMLMMSWRSVSLPVMLIPEEKREEVPPPEKKLEKRKLSIVEWGKELFESKGCSECHTIGGGVEVGPDLIGITKLRDIQWLRKMILDPEKMEQTDPLAKKLYQEYEETGMPTEELTLQEVEAIIKYIESFNKESN
ncbi:MAG: c-type cytochrome [Candidatus Aminicenantes bacterium]|nr:c-type cytochrome [Candidatus Aminicenantes bacterium]